MKNTIQTGTSYVAVLTMSCAMLASQALLATDFVPAGDAEILLPEGAGRDF